MLSALLLLARGVMLLADPAWLRLGDLPDSAASLLLGAALALPLLATLFLMSGVESRRSRLLSNATRAHMSEFGIVAPVGRIGLERLLAIVADKDDERIPRDARICLEMLGAQLTVVKEQILENDRLIRASARDTEVVRRLMEIPGVGPLLASAFVASVADPQVFKTGRDLAAWIGLVPRQNSSGGKERLGGISRAGNQYLRQMLVVGAMAVIRHAERHGTKRVWLIELMKRRATKVAASP